MSRIQGPFGALILAQAAHSIEEYVGRLWESFPPAAFVTGLVSCDRDVGFLVLNCVLVACGLWCLAWPVRMAWPSAVVIAWFWVALEAANGIGHSAWSVWQRAYTPGVLTAPILLTVALYLARQLTRDRPALSRTHEFQILKGLGLPLGTRDVVEFSAEESSELVTVIYSTLLFAASVAQDVYIVPDHGRAVLKTDHHDVVHVACRGSVEMDRWIQGMAASGFALPDEPLDETFKVPDWMKRH